MNKILLFLCLLMTVLVKAQDEIYFFEKEEYEGFMFKANETVFAFGDNVKLRSKPNTNSETLDKIRIGEQLTILQVCKEKMKYNEVLWHWYKVKYKNKIGYILGGLLSRSSQFNNRDTSLYLINFRKEKEKYHYYLTIRLLNDVNSKNYIQYEVPFEYVGLYVKIEVDGSKGVSNIKDMIYIDFNAEEEGAENGGLYLFNTGQKLIKAIEIDDEGGENYLYREQVIFPIDQEGVKGKIIVKTEEQKNLYNRKGNYYKETVEKEIFELLWKGKELKIPKIRKSYFIIEP